MAVELLICETCGNKWIRRLQRHQSNAEVCANCRTEQRGRGIRTFDHQKGIKAATGRMRFDADIQIAFGSQPLHRVLPECDAVQALCPACVTTWDADMDNRSCPSCEYAFPRVIATEGDLDHSGQAIMNRESIRDALIQHSAIGEQRARRILAVFPDARSLEAAQIEVLLNIPGVGPRVAETAKDAARRYLERHGTEGMQALWPCENSTASLSDGLMGIPGVGETKALRIVSKYPDVGALAGADWRAVAQIPGVGRRASSAAIQMAKDRLRNAESTEFAARGSSQTRGRIEAESQDDVGNDWDEDGAWTKFLSQFLCTVCAKRHLDLPGRREWPLCRGCDTGKTVGAGHGVTAALRKGCRCAKCLGAVAQARWFVSERLRGRTLQELGEQVGLSRERVRQLTEQVDPSKPWEAVERVEQREGTEVAEVAEAALAAIHQRREPACPVCGSTVFGVTRRFCSDDCRNKYNLLRYHIDPERRKLSKLRTSRWILENAEDLPEYQIRHAKRVVAGDAIIDGGRRWLVKGSETFKAAVEIVVNQWPLADLLPDDIRAQIDEHLGRSDDASMS